MCIRDRDKVTGIQGISTSGEEAGTPHWLFQVNDNKLRLYVKNAYYTSDTNLSTGIWYFVAFAGTQSGGGKFYLNGVDDGNIPAWSTGSSGTQCSIGRSGDGNYFDGIIDEVAIYNRTLSATEILDHYKRGALRLNLTARSCDDSNCDTESWTDITDISPQDLSVNNNTYFQYKFEFETDNISYSPELYNVTVDYTAPNTPPQITINAPENGSTSNETYRLLNATVTDDDNDLMNITFYGSFNSTNSFYELNTSTNIANGTTITYNWSEYESNVDDDMVLLMHMNEASGTIVDYSGQGNNGTLIAGVYGVDGKFNTAIYLDGTTNKYITIPMVRSSETYTVGMWLYFKQSKVGYLFDARDGGGTGYCYQNGLNLVKSSGTIYIDGVASSAITLNKWHHIVVKDITLDITSNFKIGRWGTSSSAYINSNVDEIAIWNKSLSAQEVQELYQLKAGTYYWYANVTDGENTTKSETWQFTVGTPDIIAPTILSTSPSNGASLSAGTTSYVIKLTTNETAVCRYNTTDQAWDNMTQLTNTSSTQHNFTVTGLSDGNTYNLSLIHISEPTRPY